jgi:hypothetical protein
VFGTQLFEIEDFLNTPCQAVLLLSDAPLNPSCVLNALMDVSPPMAPGLLSKLCIALYIMFLEYSFEPATTFVATWLTLDDRIFACEIPRNGMCAY